MQQEKTLEPAQALGDIVELLDKAGIRYFLVGSFASGFRGEFRATNDLDLVSDFPKTAVVPFCEEAKSKFYCDELTAEAAVREGRSFNIIHEDTFVKVDLFTKISPFEEEQFSLCSSLLIPGTDKRASVSTAEYNIIAKINWYLKSNRVLDRQLRDVRSMIQVNRRNLDLEYLRRWAEHFDTSVLLEELLTE